MTIDAAARRQQPLTHLTERLVLTALVLGVLAAIYALMWRSWRRRARRSPYRPAPVPTDLGTARLSASGTYVVTTVAGDWLTRVTRDGLGLRGPAELVVTDAGVLIDRDGRPDVWLSAASLTGVRRESGMTGTFVEEGGIVVLTTEQGEHSYDVGFRPRHPEDSDAIVHAVTALTEVRSP